MSEDTVGLGNGGAEPASATPTKKTRGAVTADADLTAMARISSIINGLQADDRTRVIRWVGEKYGREA